MAVAISFIKKHYKKIYFLLFILLIIQGALSIFIPLDRDEGAYAYIGWLWLSGKGIPYLSAFDQKTPLPYILYGLGNLLVHNSYIGIKVVAFVYKIAIIGTIYSIVRIFSSRLVAWSIVLIGGSYLFSVQLEGTGFNTEFAMLLPFVIFVYIIVKLSKQNQKRNLSLSFLSGITGGLALFGKSVAVFPIIFLLLWYGWKKRNISSLIMIISGLGLVLGLTVLYFYLNHAFNDFIQDVVVYNRYYVRDGLRIFYISKLTGLPGIFGYPFWFIKMPDVMSSLFVFALASIIFTSFKRNSAWWIGLLIACGTFFGAKSGGTREFPHYYLPVVVGFSFCLIPLFTILTKKKRTMTIVLITLVLSVMISYSQIAIYIQGTDNVQNVQFSTQSQWFKDAFTVGKWTKNHLKQNDSLLVWANEPEIYYYANKMATTKYTNFYGFFYSPELRKEWDKQVRAYKPSYIITYTNDPGSFAELQEYFKKIPSFHRITKIGSYIVYKNYEK